MRTKGITPDSRRTLLSQSVSAGRRVISKTENEERALRAESDAAREHIEEVNLQQQKRLEQTSRLITMGEMASTRAHELNQPLAAIANYSMGCVNRLQSGDYRQEDILAAMLKADFEKWGPLVKAVGFTAD